MPEVSINWVAVIAATAANMVIGALWFSPVLFAKPWTAEVEKTIGKERFQRLHDAMRSKAVAFRTYGITAIGAFLVAYVMGLVADWRAADTIVEGVMFGGVLWLGFVVPTGLVTVLFEGRSPRVYLMAWPIILWLSSPQALSWRCGSRELLRTLTPCAPLSLGKGEGGKKLGDTSRPLTKGAWPPLHFPKAPFPNGRRGERLLGICAHH